MAEKRLILVNFEANDYSKVSFQFQVDLSKMQNFTNDRERIVSAIEKQHHQAASSSNSTVSSQEIELLLESTEFPGAIVRFPDSPLSHKSVVRARFKRQPLLELNNLTTSNDPNTSLMTDFGDPFNGSVTDLIVASINASIDLESGFNEGYQPTCSLQTHQFESSAINRTATDIATANSDPGCSKTLPDKIVRNLNEVEGFGENRNRSIPLSKFTWRSFFSTTISKKLKNGIELSVQEENAMCRSLCEDILQFTDCPDPTSLKNFVEKMLSIYPGLLPIKDQMDHETREVIKEVWEKKLGKRLSRLRSENGTQLKCGRPPCKKLKTMPHSSGSGLPTSDVLIDWVSYKENVTKMISFHADAPNHPSLDSLYQLTFTGRRARLTGGEFEGNATSLMTDECPLLAYEHYLCKEMDTILKKADKSSAVTTFKNKWRALVPKIILLAEQQERSCKNIRSVLQSRSDLDDETIALQLLVLFLPGKVKALKGVKFLIEVIDDSENITTAAEKLPRISPFLIKCGKEFHIVVDSKPAIHLSNDPTDALVCLIATFYAFHIHWTSELRLLFSFVETYLLDQHVQCDKITKAKLEKFLRLLSSVTLAQ